MKILALDMTQAALYLRQGLSLVDARTVWLRGQLLLGMDFEGETAEAVQAEWNGFEVPMVAPEDYRQLIRALAAKVGVQ
jgi:hypothetical protein